MPELPEVETVRRGLVNTVLGKTINKVTLGRYGLRRPFPEGFSSLVQGAVITDLIRRGKYIICLLGNGQGIIFHLGMSGKISVMAEDDWQGNGKHDHAVFMLSDSYVMVLNDPRRFGLLDIVDTKKLPWQEHELFIKMGEEPLSEEFCGNLLWSKLLKTTRPIKTILLDQSVVAGLGNIYVCEALFSSRLSPFRRGCDVTQEEAEILAGEIKAVLLKAIEAGGSTLKDYSKVDGGSGYFQHSFQVYDREGEQCKYCKSCKVPYADKCPKERCTGIIRTIQSGRSTFYCPCVQR